jgi:transposase
MASKPETVEKMEKAQKLAREGKSIPDIAKQLGMSESRVKELLKGVNWNSRTGKSTRIE